MNPIDIQHLRGLMQKATPGEWVTGKASSSGMRAVSVGGVGMIAKFYTKTDSCKERPANGNHNAVLAVAAVNSLPTLLDEIERLRAKLGE